MTTLPRANLLVSFILATHNRREVLLETLSRIHRCGLQRDAFEIFVVDNASTDGTARAVSARFPDVLLLYPGKNFGSCAKNLALLQARGRFVVFLDDDSYPLRDSVARMIHHFERDPLLGAAVFTIHLPDGSREASAYPDVFIGCGTGFRRRALSQVGGLPDDFFMQAEEYDLSLRLLDAGWDVRQFDDLHAMHLKTSQSRRSDRVMQLDVRNNLILARRYLPKPWSKWFADDWLDRYWKIARANNQRGVFIKGAIQGLIRAHLPGQRHPISDVAFESFAKTREIESRLSIAQHKLDLRSVMFIDLGKNILPFWMAATKLGIEIVAIADGRFAGSRYRGIEIVDDIEAKARTFDAAVLSNLSPAHASTRRDEWRASEHFRPVIDLFEDDRFSAERFTDPNFISAVPAESESRQTVARSA